MIQDDIVEQIVDALLMDLSWRKVSKKSQGKGANDLSVYEWKPFFNFAKHACCGLRRSKPAHESIKVEPDYAELLHLAHNLLLKWI